MLALDFFRHKYQDLLERETIGLTTDNANIMVILSVFHETRKTVFVVAPNLNVAQKYYDAMSSVSEDCLFYPCDDLSTAEMIIASIEFKLERINTIKTLLEKEPKVVITNVNGFLKIQQSPEVWVEHIIDIEKNVDVNVPDLTNKLVTMGYRRNYIVERVGEFSIRGSIIDIFPLNYTNPIRIDLFGDTVDVIKEFDLNKQVSLREIKNVTIPPLNEIFYNETKLSEVVLKMEELAGKVTEKEKEYINSDIERLRNRKGLDLLGKYISFFSGNSTIIDFASEKKIFVVEPYRVKDKEERMVLDLFEFSKGAKTPFLNSLKYFKTLEEVYMNNSIVSLYNMVEAKYNLYAKETINYANNEHLLITDFKKTDITYLVTLRTEQRIKMLETVLEKGNVKYRKIESVEDISKGVNLLLDNNSLNVELYKDRIVILTEESIFSDVREIRKFKYKSVFGETKRIKSVEDLVPGDYVVHYDYGIGIYLGLKTMQLQAEKRDYIHVMYAKEASIYVPVEAIDLIQRYNGREGFTPTLSELGTSKWANTKNKVKKKIKDISEKLIKIYALRESAQGIAFEKDAPEQKEFENDFLYEETDDQLIAIEEMKKDMEMIRPMDRLICGDVGYGKTEIAMRGAFKAIMSGKQVAYLAPTTMLSRQHYHTFKPRFEKFGAKVALLNRFVSMKTQKEILQKLKLGEIDCIIGTHRILSKDIVFKELGLLIIDEEQRFGVEHKERIKEIKVNVDTLTLTATPIPRTLQMSIMGIKDISILNTPPKNRYPIQTYVLERNDLVIKDAIERELSRQGQVFYLYNKTQTIEQMAVKIREMIPDARVGFAHGQMNKYELEYIIESFIEHEYDVLVCTTIIETGIDIPNTNTIIVHDADMLGLSQLYQIRGRVGRSDRIAYAYLMYDGRKVLNENSMKRLEAIKDFTELGSGYKIAMRDLSIRGAGDILGSEQSGFVDTVGIELYLKILKDTVKESQGIEVDTNKEVGKVMSSRHIPESYVNDDGVRIDIHKKIDNVKTIKELENLREELIDRFGAFDEKVSFYMYEKLFKYLSRKMGAESIMENRGKLVITLSEEASSRVDGERLFLYTKDFYALNIAYLNKKISLTLNIYEAKSPWVKAMCEYLENVLS